MYKRNKADKNPIGDLENPIYESTLVTDNLDLNYKKVIEIGCGTAPHAKIKAPYCLEYYAIDINRRKINQANKSNKEENLHLAVMNGAHLSYADRSFEIALMFHCLHEACYEEQSKILKETYRILANNGFLLIIDTISNPVSKFQEYFDIIHENIFDYKHIYGVLHSEWLIDQYITRGLFEEETDELLKMDFVFSNINDLINCLKMSFEYEISWDQALIKKIDNLLNKRLIKDFEHNKIVLEEIVKLRVLKKI